MSFPDNSPPKGDYVAYVDKLMRQASAQAQAAPPMPAPPPSTARNPSSRTAPPAAPPARSPATAAPSSSQGSYRLPDFQNPMPPKARKSRPAWLLIVAVLAFLPLLGALKALIQDPSPEIIFVIAAILFVVMGVRDSLRSTREKRQRQQAQGKE